jgi:hypothetical protein
MSMYFEAAANVGKTLDEVQRQRGPSRKVLVPNFVGVRGSDIWVMALGAGVHVKLHAIDQNPGDVVVIAQEPPANSRVRRGTEVNLSVDRQ